MASTHKKQLTTTVRPSSLLSNQDIIAVVSGDTDIGERIASVNDLRFSTAAGLWLEWMPIAFSLVGGSLTATFRILRPTILSSEDLVTEIHYGGTPDGSAPGPATTLSYDGSPIWASDMESSSPSLWAGDATATGSGNLGIATGKTADCVSFGGTDGFISTSVSLPSDHTISGWIKPTTFTNFCGLIHRQTTNSVLWSGIRYQSKNFRYYLAGTDVAVFSPTAGVWQHFAVTRTDGLLTGYKNGTVTRSPIAANGIPLVTVIGYDYQNSFGRNYNGLMDDLRFYGRGLSGDEIVYHVSQVNSPGTWGPEIAIGGTRKHCIIAGSPGYFQPVNSSIIVPGWV